MKTKFLIQFEYSDLGQTIDALNARAQAWEDTATFLLTGEMPEEFFVAEECNDANEANKIAKDFRSITGKIEKQVEAQGGWQRA
jgi:hypothetical protein